MCAHSCRPVAIVVRGDGHRTLTAPLGALEAGGRGRWRSALSPSFADTAAARSVRADLWRGGASVRVASHYCDRQVNVVASNRVLIALAVWFFGFGGLSLAYMVDSRGWLTRIVDERVAAASAVAFDPASGQKARWTATQLMDKQRVRRQQRIAAGCSVAFCAAFVASCLASLFLRD